MVLRWVTSEPQLRTCVGLAEKLLAQGTVVKRLSVAACGEAVRDTGLLMPKAAYKEGICRKVVPQHRMIGDSGQSICVLCLSFSLCKMKLQLIVLTSWGYLKMNQGTDEVQLCLATWKEPHRDKDELFRRLSMGV